MQVKCNQTKRDALDGTGATVLESMTEQSESLATVAITHSILNRSSWASSNLVTARRETHYLPSTLPSWDTVENQEGRSKRGNYLAQ